MNLSKFRRVFFIGIGGIGMSALARYFNFLGLKVEGYDRMQTKLTNKLVSEKIKIHFEDTLENIDNIFLQKESTLVIYTPAIPSEHLQLNYFKTNDFTLMKRSEVLGLITKNKKAIAVAGTHGKTTVTSMISHLLHKSKIGCDAFIGGISKNYNSNLILSKKSKYVVVEADEFDRSFLQLFPNMAIITATDADHLDIYGKKENLLNSFKEFIRQIDENGVLFVKENLALDLKETSAKTIYTYSLENKESDFFAENRSQKLGIYTFDLQTPFGKIRELKLGMPGLINLENAVVALAVASVAGANEEELKLALLNFEGIKRRFDYRINTEKMVYIDDYAHHPEELKAVIASVREIYNDKKITGVFQPHLFSRTRDFVEEFAESLNLLDEIILLDIYPARELPIEGITSKIILEKIKNKNKILCKKEELLEILKSRSLEVLLSLGAGDIDKLVEPIQVGINNLKKT